MERENGNTSHNCSYHPLFHSQVSQGYFNKRPLESIISLFKVHLKHHPPLTPFPFCSHGVDDVLGHNYVVTALSDSNETTLVGAHNTIHYTSEAITENLGNDSIADFAQGNMSEIYDMLWFIHYRDKDKISVVNMSDHGRVDLKLSNHLPNSRPYNLPIFLVKNSLNTIWSWCFEAPISENGSINLFIRNSCCQVSLGCRTQGGEGCCRVQGGRGLFVPLNSSL